MKPELWIPLATCVASFLGTLAVVIVGFTYNNSRLSDLNSSLNSRMSDFRSEMGERLKYME